MNQQRTQYYASAASMAGFVILLLASALVAATCAGFSWWFGWASGWGSIALFTVILGFLGVVVYSIWRLVVHAEQRTAQADEAVQQNNAYVLEQQNNAYVLQQQYNTYITQLQYNTYIAQQQMEQKQAVEQIDEE